MKRAFPALLAVASGLSLAGCVMGVSTAGIGGTQTPQLAPPVPAKETRSHGQRQQMTGIRGDAVAAILGDADRSYIYYDVVAADPETVKAAPAKLCAGYGRTVQSSHVTTPENQEPGVKVLAVDCKA